MSSLISLSPNVERDDVRLALRTLFRPWTWNKDEAALVKAQEKVSTLIPGSSAVLASSGRTALFAILTASGIEEHDEVIVQAFTCVAVPGAVSWAGARPVFVDIDSETLNMDIRAVERAITPRTKAIVVQHTFGIPGPTGELRTLADKYGLLLIEDLAHSLRDGASKLAGHVGFMSFGRDKIVSSVFGGAVVSADNAFLSRVSKTQLELAHPPSRWVAQQLLHPILMTVIKRWYFLGAGKFLLVAAQKFSLLSKAVSASERSGSAPGFKAWGFSPALAVLLIHQLDKLDVFTQRRITAVNQYADRLMTVRPWRHLPLLRVPVRVTDKKKLLLKAREHQLMLGDWYRVVVEPCSLEQLQVLGYEAGSCPEAERAAHEVINLPTHPTMHATEAQRVINFVMEHISQTKVS